jgi:hypothetical protein
MNNVDVGQGSHTFIHLYLNSRIPLELFWTAKPAELVSVKSQDGLRSSL